MSLSDRSDLDRRAWRTIWTAIVGPPALFLLSLQMHYAFVNLACAAGSGLLLLVFTLPAIGLTVWSARDAFALWRMHGQSFHADGNNDVQRARFIGGLGALVAGFFVLMLIAQAMPNLIINACSGM
jgi:hypothetical protein